MSGFAYCPACGGKLAPSVAACATCGFAFNPVATGRQRITVLIDDLEPVGESDAHSEPERSVAGRLDVIIDMFESGDQEGAYNALVSELRQADEHDDLEAISFIPIVARQMSALLRGRARSHFEALVREAEFIARERIPLSDRLSALADALAQGDDEQVRFALWEEYSVARDDEDALRAIHAKTFELSRQLEGTARNDYDRLTLAVAERIDELRTDAAFGRVDTAYRAYRSSGGTSEARRALQTELSKATKAGDEDALAAVAATARSIAKELYGSERLQFETIARSAEDHLEEAEEPEVYGPYANPTVGLWGFAVFFFGAVGGFVGWLSLKNTDRDRADHILKWGFIWSGVGFVLSVLFYALFFAILLKASR